ncbi:MAG: OsmC family protein [Lewinellaceae bacterium]|nr:OsmC family protein [Saprospiraceae bacterium]MCB9314204.1 OsmC family protein [Lewinellaceae bacterium]HRW74916.1 OsmC family protein [Saprospiraceae bacterium]
MTSEVIYLGDLRTKATHLQSGDSIITDAPIDNQGKGEAFSPTDLCATSLASCILTIMGIKARDHQIDMSGTRATVLKTMVADPDRRIGRIDIDIYLPEKNWTVEDRSILTQAAASCPVCRSLSPALEIRKQLIWP